ncbi:MBL fold metallo-hydrolase [Streptomyces sp. DSM 15324]|uniref:MBL fold metallo-hydrolase n=1 Tax=Streptomyces sp. DSM 15324 TaxID=1739111 RepID=UPI000748E627|nr:MBL fold metallo-hydrolase [Streptomyces sp. DSM 15324]KUO12476.1 MBL fold metallo-hydrolase [Streptomyces sp. DSM 15324]
MSNLRITHIGGPTTLIETGGWRLLTDPTFDPPGERYTFGWGTSSHKSAGPALSAAELPPIDAVLLSHDHHGDNLDRTGRDVLRTARTVLTTPAGARRLGSPARGLAPWTVTRLHSPGRPTLEVTATPARHGPPLSRPLTGQVIGFALTWEGQQHGALWISGDTVLHRGVREVARRLTVGTALLHVGGVRFPITGPVRYTMTAARAVELCGMLRPHTAVPVHYEGWQHFHEGRDAVERALARAPAEIRARFRLLPTGTATDIGA